MNRRSRLKRKARVRSKIRGTKERPRLSVYRSNRFIYAQLIDDDKGTTVLSISEKDMDFPNKLKKAEAARELGLLLAKRAIDKKIEKVILDRGGYSYSGKISSLARGAREGGLEF